MSRHILTVMLLLVSAMNAANAQDATNAAGATNVSDAQSASGERNAIVKSDAAAKRQAKSADAGKDAKASGKGDVDSDAAAESKDEVKTLSGISILGNQEAPKSLVIVPWKSSEIGDMPGLSRLLDDSVQPIDKEVFMRELDYYEIRSSSR